MFSIALPIKRLDYFSFSYYVVAGLGDKHADSYRLCSRKLKLLSFQLRFAFYTEAAHIINMKRQKCSPVQLGPRFVRFLYLSFDIYAREVVKLVAVE